MSILYSPSTSSIQAVSSSSRLEPSHAILARVQDEYEWLMVQDTPIGVVAKVRSLATALVSVKDSFDRYLNDLGEGLQAKLCGDVEVLNEVNKMGGDSSKEFLQAVKRKVVSLEIPTMLDALHLVVSKIISKTFSKPSLEGASSATSSLVPALPSSLAVVEPVRELCQYELKAENGSKVNIHVMKGSLASLMANSGSHTGRQCTVCSVSKDVDITKGCLGQFARESMDEGKTWLKTFQQTVFDTCKGKGLKPSNAIFISPDNPRLTDLVLMSSPVWKGGVPHEASCGAFHEAPLLRTGFTESLRRADEKGMKCVRFLMSFTPEMDKWPQIIRCQLAVVAILNFLNFRPNTDIERIEILVQSDAESHPMRHVIEHFLSVVHDHEFGFDRAFSWLVQSFKYCQGDVVWEYDCNEAKLSSEPSWRPYPPSITAKLEIDYQRRKNEVTFLPSSESSFAQGKGTCVVSELHDLHRTQMETTNGTRHRVRRCFKKLAAKEGAKQLETEKTSHGATEPLSDEHEIEQDSLAINVKFEKGQ